MGHQRCADPARAGAGQFLGLYQTVEQGEGIACAAEFLRIVEAEHTGLRRLAVQLARQFARGFPLVDVGSDFLCDEGADAVADRLVAFVIERRARPPLVEQGRFHGFLPIIPAALAPPPYVTLNLVQGLFLRKAQPSNSNSKPLDLLVFRNLRACRAMDPEPSSG